MRYPGVKELYFGSQGTNAANIVHLYFQLLGDKSCIFCFPQYRPQTLKTANFNSKLLILWLTTGGKEYFFMDRTGLREFLSFEREF